MFTLLIMMHSFVMDFSTVKRIVSSTKKNKKKGVLTGRLEITPESRKYITSFLWIKRKVDVSSDFSTF